MAKQIKSKPTPDKKSSAPKKKSSFAWEKSSEELIQIFYNALPEDNKVERKKMFGYPCVFVNGNMAAGMYRQHIIARQNETKRKEWVTKKGATIFEPMPGRPMKEYIVIPEEIVQNPIELKKVLQESVNFVLTLKPKEKKEKKNKRS